MLDVKKWMSKVTNALKVDYIVEQGTSGIWTYHKWNSGIAECWGTNVTTGTFSAWGQGYSHDVSAISYPTNLFVSPPTVFINSQFTSGNAVSSASGGGNKDQTPMAILIRLGAAPSGTLTFNTWYQAKGKWK